MRSFLALASDGQDPQHLQLHVQHLNSIYTVYVNYDPKGKKLGLKVKGTGNGYELTIFDKDGEVERELELSAGELADIMLAASLLCQHGNLARFPEFYELKI